MNEEADENDEIPIDDRYTRRDARNTIHYAAQELANELVAVREDWFVQLPLRDEPELFEALTLARRLKKGARRRQTMFLTRLIKEIEPGQILDALATLKSGHELEVGVFHEFEVWRDTLIAEGMPALERFLAEYPQANRQRLRQLLRQASKLKAPPKAARSLFKALREVAE